jgi:hypothetical protein
LVSIFVKRRRGRLAWPIHLPSQADVGQPLELAWQLRRSVALRHFGASLIVAKWLIAWTGKLDGALNFLPFGDFVDRVRGNAGKYLF